MTTLPTDVQNEVTIEDKANRLLKEMQAHRHAFEIETQEDVNALEEEFMAEKHYLHVTDEAISEVIAGGLRDINEAADTIDLPDDDDEIDAL